MVAALCWSVIWAALEQLWGGIPSPRAKEKSQRDSKRGKLAFNQTPFPPETLRGLKQTLCAPGPRDSIEPETELCLSSLGGHKQNLAHTRTQEKGAVTPQETDQDLPGSVQESPAGGVGRWWTTAGLPTLSIAVQAWDLLKEVTIIFITCTIVSVQFSSVRFSQSVMSDSLRPHESQQASLSITNSWSLLKLMSMELVMPYSHFILCRSFSSCPQCLPASGSFSMSQLFTWGGQSIGVSASASVLPMKTQNWSPLGWTGWITFQSKGLSRVFSNTTVQKHQPFGAQLSL